MARERESMASPVSSLSMEGLGNASCDELSAKAFLRVGVKTGITWPVKSSGKCCRPKARSSSPLNEGGQVGWKAI